MRLKTPRDIYLKLECFAGADIEDATKELCQVAKRVGIMCEVNFNGVYVWARPDDDPAKLVNAYHQELKSDVPFKIAQVILGE